ncbi:hypothetical protein D3C78_758350 [compost metagenome]
MTSPVGRVALRTALTPSVFASSRLTCSRAASPADVSSGLSDFTITVVGSESPGPKLSEIILNAFTESYLSPISSSELKETEPLYAVRSGTMITARIISAHTGRFKEKAPTLPHSLLCLCSREPLEGQNSALPSTAMKNGTIVNKARSSTATPIATATAER